MSKVDPPPYTPVKIEGKYCQGKSEITMDERVVSMKL
jgi:hypothetical protein